MAGTYPGAATYPGPTTYPGAAPLSGASTLDLTGSGTLTLLTVLKGSSTLALSGTGFLTFTGPNNGASFLALSGLGTLTLVGFGSNSTNPSIAGFPEPGNLPPRVLLQASNITGPSGQVLRYGPDGQSTPVRSGDPAPLNSGAWIGYDYEAPFNVPVYYVFQPADGSAAQVSPPVTLRVSRPWLIHPGVPELSVQVTVKLLDDETINSSGGLHSVLERRTPIPVTDGVRKAPSFPMLVKSKTKAERDDLDQLFLDTAPLLLQVVYPDQTDESVYQWIYVDTITRARRDGAAFGDPVRIWTLQCYEVDRPLGGIRAQRTWADVMAECPTWADVLARYKTWRGVLTGIPGT